MTRANVSARNDVLEFANETDFQRHVVAFAMEHGWGITAAADRKLDEELAAYQQPPAVLDGLVFHPRIMYRSEPGWPDLTLIRRRDRRIVFSELKTDDEKKSKVSARQAKVLDLLRSLATPGPRRVVDGSPCWCVSDVAPHRGWIHSPACLAIAIAAGIWPRIEVFVWRPRDLPEIQRVLA